MAHAAYQKENLKGLISKVGLKTRQNDKKGEPISSEFTITRPQMKRPGTSANYSRPATISALPEGETDLDLY